MQNRYIGLKKSLNIIGKATTLPRIFKSKLSVETHTIIKNLRPVCSCSTKYTIVLRSVLMSTKEETNFYFVYMAMHCLDNRKRRSLLEGRLHEATL